MPKCSNSDLDKRLIHLEQFVAALNARSEERDRRYEDGSAASKEALRFAKEALEQRLDNLNHWHNVSTEAETQYARWSEVKLSFDATNSAVKSNQDRVNGLADLVHAQVQRGGGMREAWGYVVGAIATVVALITVAVHIKN